MPDNRGTKGVLVLAAAFCAYAALQAAWLAVDRRPTVEERHFFSAARLAHRIAGSEAGRAYPDCGETSPYPPLVVLLSSPVMALFGVSADTAVLTLLPYMALLLWAAWRICRLYFSVPASVAASLLVLCFHDFVVAEPNYPAYAFSKQFLLDMPLSAWTAACLYFLLMRFRDGRMRYGVALGIAAGCGALTKISFPPYFFVLTAAAVISGEARVGQWRRLLFPAAVAALIAAPWYMWRAGDIAQVLIEREFNPAWARECGMPPIFSVEGFICLFEIAHEMISLPLAVLSVAGLVSLVVWRRAGWKLAAAGSILTYAALSLTAGKSGRLLAPCMLFPAMAIAHFADVLPSGWVRRIAVPAVAAAVLGRVAFMNGMFPRLLFLVPPSFAEAVTPAPDTWAVDAITECAMGIRDKSLLPRIAVAPYLGHFRHASFMQYAFENNLRIGAESEWMLRGPLWSEELERCEFVVTKTGAQGPPRFTPHARDVGDWLKDRVAAGDSRLAAVFSLPDGSEAMLFQNRLEFKTWRVVDEAPRRALAIFGGAIGLYDYALDCGGDALTLRCGWACEKTPQLDCRFFIQVREGYRVKASATFAPGNGLKPAMDWTPGFAIEETYRLPLPQGPPGVEYDVWIGWHRMRGRLRVSDSIFPVFLNAVCVGKAPARH